MPTERERLVEEMATAYWHYLHLCESTWPDFCQKYPEHSRHIREAMSAALTVADAAGERCDDPDLDATDFAHPAWWRGHDHTATVFCYLVTEILDGKDSGAGSNNEPWGTVRRRLLALSRHEAAIRADEREACAKWHDEMAAGMRHVAETIRRDWCTPDIEPEDRRANHADAREHDTKARWHDGCAAALGPRASKPARSLVK